MARPDPGRIVFFLWVGIGRGAVRCFVSLGAGLMGWCAEVRGDARRVVHGRFNGISRIMAVPSGPVLPTVHQFVEA